MSAAPADHERIRPEPPKTYYEGLVRIPGYGRAPNRCRGMKPVGFCEHGHTILGRSSCGTYGCPDHFRDAIEEATISIVARLAAYRQAQPEGAARRLSHVAVSPPQDRRYSEDRLYGMRSEAYDALEAAGVPGGTGVLHPYRTNKRGDALYETAKEHGEVAEGVGRWRFLREGADEWEDIARYTEASPHLHTFAPGEDIDGGDAPDGWVVERIRTFKPFYLYDTEAYRDMAKSVYYTLTHAAHAQDRQAVTHFGQLAGATFQPEEELTAAEWDRIKMEAEKAVKGREEVEGTAGPEECPRDDCEAEVRDIAFLEDVIDDPDFEARVKRQRGGRKRWRALCGAYLWWDDRTDRPPPSVAQSKPRLLEWLRDRGEWREVEPSQVSIQTAVMSGD